jgi:phage shock protein PspC (stress-responsive transcriptional regulator)
VNAANTLLTTGLACIIAAIIGGGLKAFGIEIAVLRSWKRQTLLAMFGAMLTIAGYVIQRPAMPESGPVEILLFDNKNSYKVFNNPPHLPEFTIFKPHYVTFIWDYHHNDGKGTVPGNIKLQRSDGTIYGPWEVLASDNQSMKDWECKPRTSIPAGTYTIVDSDKATWSWNKESNEMGMSKVKGYPVK